MRIIVDTGKGGVGKTTVSAATALRCSRLGKKTLVMSTDAAHSLGDSLGSRVGDKPTKISENFYAQEIDMQKELDKHYGLVQDYLETVYAKKGVDSVLAKELTIFPGMDELFSLVEIKQHYEDQKYDVLVVDCAPTASTIRLLNFPETFGWYIEKILRRQQQLLKLFRPFMKFIKSDMPTMPDSFFEAMNTVYEKIGGIKEILSDRENTTVRLVTNSEKMVIEESQKAYTYLSLFGYRVDGVIVNKLLPEEIKDPYFEKWKQVQSKHLKLVNEGFYPLPIFKAPLFETEPVGLEALGELSDRLWGDKDPSEIFYREQPIRLEKEGKDYVLSLSLPFSSKEDVELNQAGNELIVRIRNFKRIVALPVSLQGKEVKKARFEKNRLLLTFTGGVEVE